MRCELGFVVGNRKEDEEGPPLHLASEEILAAALRTELDRKKNLAAAAPAILWRFESGVWNSG